MKRQTQLPLDQTLWEKGCLLLVFKITNVTVHQKQKIKHVQGRDPHSLGHLDHFVEMTDAGTSQFSPKINK